MWFQCCALRPGFSAGFIVPVSKPFQRSGFRVGFRVVLQIRFRGLVSEPGFRVDFRIAALLLVFLIIELLLEDLDIPCIYLW